MAKRFLVFYCYRDMLHGDKERHLETDIGSHDGFPARDELVREATRTLMASGILPDPGTVMITGITPVSDADVRRWHNGVGDFEASVGVPANIVRPTNPTHPTNTRDVDTDRQRAAHGKKQKKVKREKQ